MCPVGHGSCDFNLDCDPHVEAAVSGVIGKVAQHRAAMQHVEPPYELRSKLLARGLHKDYVSKRFVFGFSLCKHVFLPEICGCIHGGCQQCAPWLIHGPRYRALRLNIRSFWSWLMRAVIHVKGRVGPC